MIQRLALFGASLATALVVALGLALAGFGPAPSPADPGAGQVATTPEAAPVQVDTVYLTPEATPEQITVTTVRTASRGGDEAEHERGERGGDD